MRAMFATSFGLCIALGLTAASRAADEWSQWRGPNFNGSAEATNLPVTWSATENTVWITDLPGPSAATPSVSGGRIFITSMDDETLEIFAMCLDRSTGKILWKRGVGQGRRGPKEAFENSKAECSPVSDGAVACFMFGSGVLTAFDMEGTRLWRRDVVEEHGPIEGYWGYASSPLLYDGTLYVQVLRTGESYLLAVDPMTGETRFRHVRPDTARAESEQAYTSPILFDNGGRTEILLLGADCLTGHDPKTGEEHWRWSELNPNDRGNFRAITNTVAGPDGFVYVTSPQGNPLHAIQVKGDTAKEVWTLRRGTPDVCTPLYYGDRLYVLDGRRRSRLACLDPRTGEPHWTEDLNTLTYVRSSPTAADGKIYIMDAEGFVNVVAAGDTFKLLGQTEMDSYPSRASIAIDGGQLLIRTAEQLHCVGAADNTATRDVGASNWPSFHGAGGRGVADGQALPVEWNVESGRNIRWKTPVPGLAHSSPVIWGDRLFVTTAEKDGDAELKVGLYGSIEPVDDDTVHRMNVYCLDRNTGEVVWSKTAFEGVPAVKRHPKGSHAASSPATDGRNVLAFFGSEGLYCYDMNGNLRWKRDFGVLDSGFFMVKTAQWGFASSPVIHEDVVLIQCDVQKNSFVAALSLEDGSDVWRTPRADVPTWSTPTVDVRDGRSQVILNGWKHIGGYDLRTGAELWKLVGGGDIPVPTPIVAHDLIFITNAHGRMSPIYAIEPMVSGDVSADATEQVRWMIERGGNYMQTPVVYGDHLYCCTDSGIMSRYAARTGQQSYRERLGEGRTGFTASLVAGDDKIFATSEEGDIHVVKAGPAFEVLAINEMGETCMATPAIADGTLYFRTRHHVIAVGSE